MTTRKHRARRLTAALVGLALVAAACGDDDDDASEDTQAPAEEPASTEAAEDEPESTEAMEDEPASTEAMEDEAEPAGIISEECPIPNPAENVEIDFMGWEFPIVTQYAAELEECAEGNYSFNIQFLDSQEARDTVNLDLATGDPTFEIIQGSNTFITELAGTGGLLPLNDLIDQYSDEFGLPEIADGFWDLASVDGNIYAVPMVSNSMHVFYNEPVLTEIGVAVPTTFAEALAACPAVQEAGYDTGFALMFSANWSWQIEFANVLGALGVELIDPTTGQPNWNSPEGIQAANTLVDMLNTCGGATAGTYSTDDIQAAFQTGEYVLGQTWASRAGAMDDPEASTVVGEISFAPALATETGTLAAPAFIDGYAIPKDTSVDAEQIFLAIMAAADLESQEAAAEFGTVTRAGVSNPNGPRNGEATQTSYLDGRGADVSHPAIGIANTAVGDALLQLLDGASVEDVLAQAEEAYLAEAGDQGLLS